MRLLPVIWLTVACSAPASQVPAQASNVVAAKPSPTGPLGACIRWTLDSKQVSMPTGPTVAARPIQPPSSCTELATKRSPPAGIDSEDLFAKDNETGLDLYASATAFGQRFHCMPPQQLDFSRDRIAVLWVDHQASDRIELDHAVDDKGAIEAIFRRSLVCDAPADMAERGVVMFSLPNDTRDVGFVVCEEDTAPCGP